MISEICKYLYLEKSKLRKCLTIYIRLVLIVWECKNISLLVFGN